MSAAGFWLLDASTLSLSGYKKVNNSQPRPFQNETLKELIESSWQNHVEAQFDGIMRQQKRPVVIMFENLRSSLPITPDFNIKFECASNSRVYRGIDYKWGTETFKKAAREAGIHDCLTCLS